MSTEGIYKINWLLPINLPWNSSNNILNTDKYLEDLNICLAVCDVSASYTRLCRRASLLYLHDFCCHVQKLLLRCKSTLPFTENGMKRLSEDVDDVQNKSSSSRYWTRAWRTARTAAEALHAAH